MVTKLFIAWCVMAACVAVHATGLTATLRWASRSPSMGDNRFWRSTGLLIRVAGWTILVHLLEIALWAFLYAWGGGLPDLSSSFYFSAVTYTTTGYGDIVLPPEWRLVGAIEALTGILMCGWSAGFFFAVVSRMHEAERDRSQR
jgi:Ca2+/Na+ antiporter